MSKVIGIRTGLHMHKPSISFVLTSGSAVTPQGFHLKSPRLNNWRRQDVDQEVLRTSVYFQEHPSIFTLIRT